MLLALDAGESEDEPEALWSLADILSVACGGHAGDAASMARLVRFCASAQRARLGAHPSYPDRAGFGRRTIAISEAPLADEIARQCGALAAIAGASPVRWVKPHGALYHDAARSPELARAVVHGASRALGDAISLIGPSAGALREAALAAGLGYLSEGFADRGIRADGTLVPRGEPGALITEPAAAAARVHALAGSVDVVCVHADTPGALAIARAVREALDA